MPAVQFDIGPGRWIACQLLRPIWRGVTHSALGGLRLVQVPVPALPGDDWVRVRVRLGGICGTDLRLVQLRNHPGSFLRCFMRLPLILGHEGVGTIDAVGSAVQGWQLGQRVCWDPSLSCAPRGIQPMCRPCQQGEPAICENITEGRIPPGPMVGLTQGVGGSWAPYLVVHQSQLLAVPDEVPDEDAVLVDPVACAVHGVLRAPPKQADHALVIGAGIIGLGVLAALQAIDAGCKVTAVVRDEYHAQLAERFGAHRVVRVRRGESAAARYDKVLAGVGARRYAGWFGNQAVQGGFDVVYDCIGSGQSLSDALKLTRARGTVVLLGTSQICVLDTTPIWFAELNVIGATGRQVENYQGRAVHTFEIVFDWLRTGRLGLQGLLTHLLPLRDFRKAFHLLTHRPEPVVKVAFDLRESS